MLNQVREDKASLNISLNDEEIAGMPKTTFKILLERKLKERRLVYLRGLQERKSKSKYFQFTDKMAAYLCDPRLSKSQAMLLFSLRSRSFPTKENFRNNNKDDILCDLCRLFPCSQAHLLQCPEILQHVEDTVNLGQSHE